MHYSLYFQTKTWNKISKKMQKIEMQKIVQKKGKKKKSILGPKMPYLGIFRCKFEKLLSYLKSATTNLS